jgi:hypothetical protein
MNITGATLASFWRDRPVGGTPANADKIAEAASGKLADTGQI